MVESTFKETSIDDYVEAVNERFPEMKQSDIRKILRFGFSNIYKVSMLGCDFVSASKTNKMITYIGRIFVDWQKLKPYYRLKMRKKLRVLYHMLRVKWSGYYYTYITKAEYKKYFSSPKKIRKNKQYIFKNRIVFKILDDCRLFYSRCKLFIKFEWYLDIGFSELKEEIAIRNPIIYEYDNDTQKYVNLLKSYNKYDLIDEEDSNKYI